MSLNLSISRLGLSGGRGGGASGFVPDFYVDSVGGNDSNAGTEAAPYQTLSKAATEAANIGNGVKIGLVAGSYWREELNFGDAGGLDLSGVDIRGVGDLAADGLPIIDASDVIGGTWATSTDRADANTNVYSQTLTWAGGTSRFPNFWEDGTALKAVASVATCQTTPGSFTTANGVAQDANGTSVVCYIHPYSSTNPNSDGKTYEIAKRSYALRLGSDSTAKYIWTRKQTHADGSFRTAFNCLAEGMLFSDGVKHEALMASGTFRRCVAWHPNHDLRTSAIMMEFYTSSGTGRTGTYDQCIAVGPGVVVDLNVTTQAVSAFTGHTDGVELYDSITATKCSAKFAATVISNDSNAFTVSDIYALECNVLSSSDLGTVDGVWWHATQAVQNQGRMWWSGDAVLRNAQVYLGGNAEFFGFQGNPSVTLENNIFYFNTSDDFQRVVSNVGDITVRENVFVLVGFRHGPLDSNVTPGTVFGENNVWAESTSDRYRNRIDNVLYTGIAAYLTAHPETGSVTTNPGVVDPANGDFSYTTPPTNGAGLARTPTYTPIPASLTAAEDWIIAGI